MRFDLLAGCLISALVGAGAGVACGWIIGENRAMKKREDEIELITRDIENRVKEQMKQKSSENKPETKPNETPNKEKDISTDGPKRDTTSIKSMTVGKTAYAQVETPEPIVQTAPIEHVDIYEISQDEYNNDTSFEKKVCTWYARSHDLFDDEDHELTLDSTIGFSAVQTWPSEGVRWIRNSLTGVDYEVGFYDGAYVTDF